ncbi:MAG TPA: squalene/phytoene synthase family protein [Pantanalinema sp.]
MPTATSTQHAWDTCFWLLPKVSRTFALSITILPEPLSKAICVGYLLCRLLDTIEDEPHLSLAEKADLIARLRRGIEGSEALPGDWHLLVAERHLPGSAEHDVLLMRHLPEVLAGFESLPATVRPILVRCVHEMAVGMVEMQGVFASHRKQVAALPSMDQLHRYCHYVAGTVGFMLTDLFYLHSADLAKSAYFELLERAESFGQYLQKVNILKDIRNDLAEGRLFIPLDTLSAAKLTPANLLEPTPDQPALEAISPLMLSVLHHARRAHEYLDRMPVSDRSIRLFLAYSLYFGLETIALALREPARILDQASRLKIGRLDVLGIVASLERCIDAPSALDRHRHALIEKMRKHLHPDWPPAVSEAIAALARA